MFRKAWESTEIGIGKSNSKDWESGVGILQNAQNVGDPKWETYKMLKMLKIQIGKSPEVAKPRKTSFVLVFSQSDSSSSSSSEDSADMSSSYI